MIKQLPIIENAQVCLGLGVIRLVLYFFRFVGSEKALSNSVLPAGAARASKRTPTAKLCLGGAPKVLPPSLRRMKEAVGWLSPLAGHVKGVKGEICREPLRHRPAHTLAGLSLKTNR